MEGELNDHQKLSLRNTLTETAKELLGVKYSFGAEVTDFSKKPEELDCSELVEYVYKVNGFHCPDGSQAQYEYFVDTPQYRDGDLGFFGRSAKPTQIYHVGMVWNGVMIEARGFDPNASFETGKVITRPIEKWVKFSNFVGFRCHPKLL